MSYEEEYQLRTILYKTYLCFSELFLPLSYLIWAITHPNNHTNLFLACSVKNEQTFSLSETL